LKATNTDIAIGKYLIGQTAFFQSEENFSLFEDSKNGPTGVTLLPLNHCIDLCGNSEYYLQVAIEFIPVNFCRELSQIPPTVCVILSKIASKQVFIAFGRKLPNNCFIGKKYDSPLSCVL